uniref:Uncharacterized protein n=1 Tax=Arundo donax TaxID=35708 RepID=A0A0A9RGS6_ARUDO
MPSRICTVTVLVSAASMSASETFRAATADSVYCARNGPQSRSSPARSVAATASSVVRV